ncbi:response regulator transcription factor [Paenibacillus polymyxa]|uniref:response regulator transcription factor n=1 Tax=Paenibacillus polymyxa TaxID=1406 RepID=UPI0025B68C33|nr:response regulator [Paenibacillus polymyxa]MDN4081573.1 response regulator [Paenibacillus polymyxa]MDN4089199.1 response regulator [Paenibacillus polymyxa]MDN4109572.1 response regulator [Paenibacillus polymyxa]
MYNVLIIDDEEPLREAIRIVGDWDRLGIEHIYEATNGRLGMELLGQHPIDVVMVDMKMPEMNGIEFLRVIEKAYPHLLTIVISGYNDFEFTRQAIQSRVVDYLLKPINRQDLNQALRKAVDILETRKQSQDEFINQNITLNMSLPKLKEKLYVSILDGSFKRQANTALLPLIGADQLGNRFGVIVLRLLNRDEIRRTRFHGDVDLMDFAVTNVLAQTSDERLRCFSFPHPRREREVVSICTLAPGQEEHMSLLLAQVAQKAVANLHGLFSMVVAAGVGKLCSDVVELASAYRDAKRFIHNTDVLKLEGESILHTVPRQMGTSEEMPWTDRLLSIQKDAQNGQANRAKVLLSDLLKQLAAGPVFRLQDADRLLREFHFLLREAAIELGTPMSASNQEGTLGELGRVIEGELSADFASFADYSQRLYQILELYIAGVQHAQAGNQPFDITEIKKYIERYYFEDIKISFFAETYFLSREYLMKLFKQQFGYGIHEYVQKVRMDKAKELLGDSSLKIQEISDMLGYKDKNYFSKAFRNYYQLSPSEYRVSLQ